MHVVKFAHHVVEIDALKPFQIKVRYDGRWSIWEVRCRDTSEAVKLAHDQRPEVMADADLVLITPL